jgi:hypothetical protein
VCFYFDPSALLLTRTRRGLQNKETLEKLLVSVTEARNELPPSYITSKRPRLVLKIAPDLTESQLIEMAEVIRKSSIDGVIVSNTTVQRPSFLLNGEYKGYDSVTSILILAVFLRAQARSWRTVWTTSQRVFSQGSTHTQNQSPFLNTSDWMWRDFLRIRCA